MDIKDMVLQQHTFFNSGVTKVVDYRLAALSRLRRTLMRKKYSILNALHTDLGKSSTESYMTEFGLALEEISYAEKNLRKWVKPKARRASLAQFPGDCYSIYEPFGVVLIMSPWNYPFLLTMLPLVGAIAAGNCCMVKPANDSFATSSMIREIIEEAFSEGFVSVVTGGREENQELLDQRFDYIFFTGGKTVGKIVMEKAAKHLTPFTLELGGKSPCIVDASANLKLAAKRIVFGKFLNSGQTCVAPDYVLVHQSVKTEMITHLKYWIRKMYGDTPVENSDYPHIINQKHYYRLMKLITEESVVIGGIGNERSRKIPPTVLTNIHIDSPVMQEEIFGPILPLIPFHHISQVEQVIREHPKPLALYLFTNDIRTEKRVLRNISFGGGCINDTIIHMASPHMGFGGVGESGMGSYHGKKSFETFSHEKNILKQSVKLDLPFRYHPYRKYKDIVIHMMLK